MQKVLGSIRRVRVTQSTLRNASIPEKDHRLEKYTSKILISEETERQQRCARGKAWNLAKNIYKLKEKDKATFYSPAEEWVLPAASAKEPEERDCGGFRSMKAYGQQEDLDSAELETMRMSRSPTMVMTANGEVQIREEATVYVKDLDLFVTVMLLEETPAVLSLGKLCEDHGYTYHWTSGQKPHLTKKGKRINCNIANYVPFVVLGFIYEFLNNAHTYFIIIFITGFRI